MPGLERDRVPEQALLLAVQEPELEHEDENRDEHGDEREDAPPPAPPEMTPRLLHVPDSKFSIVKIAGSIAIPNSGFSRRSTVRSPFRSSIIIRVGSVRSFCVM